MRHEAKTFGLLRLRWGPGAIALAYVILGLSWIFGSDALFDALFRGNTRDAVELGKGSAYVALTGLLLYGLTRRSFGALQKTSRELERANDELRRLAGFPEHSPHPVLLLREGEVVFANRAARAIAEAVAGGRVAALLPAGAPTLSTGLSGAQTCTAEAEARADGVVIRWSFFTNPDEGVVYAYGTDVTQVEQLGERLAEAEQAEYRERMAAGLAHDLRNMLTVVRGYAELLAPSIPPNDPARADLREILDATRRAEELLRGFSALGRTSPSSAGRIDLGQEVARLEPFLRHAVPGHIELAVEAADVAIPVALDPGQLNRLLLNLVVNAADAIGEGQGRIVVRCRTSGSEALLEVTDTGCGMDEATVARIFEPFFTTKPRDKGTGLGLVVVRAIAEQAGGTIAVTTRPGAGTTFTIRFPLAV
ncbi:MAG: HAMP domain-containing histidine kinase [Dehalococcoidia bacterium]|nr:HAMP domain-containing histidine kinase [Dehalococcoidia bacterium]